MGFASTQTGNYRFLVEQTQTKKVSELKSRLIIFDSISLLTEARTDFTFNKLIQKDTEKLKKIK